MVFAIHDDIIVMLELSVSNDAFFFARSLEIRCSRQQRHRLLQVCVFLHQFRWCNKELQIFKNWVITFIANVKRRSPFRKLQLSSLPNRNIRESKQAKFFSNYFGEFINDKFEERLALRFCELYLLYRDIIFFVCLAAPPTRNL